MQQRCYVVTYDISCPKRWRKVYRAMQGYGEHIQLSVFRCDLTPLQCAMLKRALEPLLHHQADQVLIIDLGKSGPWTIAGIEVLGRRRTFRPPAARVV